MARLKRAITRHWLPSLLAVLMMALGSCVVFYYAVSVKALAAAGQPATEPAAAVAVRPKGPPFDRNANAHTRSVMEAFEGHKNPERLSSLIKPTKFDHAAFDRNPAAYLDVVEPGRVWDTAVAGPGVTRLLYAGPAFLKVPPKGKVSLSVHAEPGMPVTFTSFDLGAFDNLLVTNTVRAGADGNATVGWTAIDGTVARVNIVAACPTCSGRLRFSVNVVPPKAQPATAPAK